jgi:hypothetical protein
MGETMFGTEVPGTLIRRIDMSPKSKLHYKVTNLLGLSAVLLILPVGSALAAEWTLDKEQLVEQPEPYSPFVDQHFPQQVFFGDTHFHSSLSVDSGLIGNRLDVETALRFARGEEVGTSTGQRVQLNRPLDFLVWCSQTTRNILASLIFSTRQIPSCSQPKWAGSGTKT